MKSHDILTVFHYLPLEDSKYAHSKGWNNQHCPVSQNISKRLVRLPLYTTLSKEELMLITETCQSFSV